MVVAVLPLLAGLAVGYMLRDVDGAQPVADAAMAVLVVVLLVLLGLAAGQDPAVVAGLGELGLKAAVIGLAATGASVAAVAWLVPEEGRS